MFRQADLRIFIYFFSRMIVDVKISLFPSLRLFLQAKLGNMLQIRKVCALRLMRVSFFSEYISLASCYSQPKNKVLSGQLFRKGRSCVIKLVRLKADVSYMPFK